MSELEIIEYPVVIDREGLVGTAEQNRSLVLEEEKLYKSTIEFMFSLKRISDGGLYTARGYKDMQTYMREYLGNKIPFALSFAKGLLQLSHKAENSDEIKGLDADKLKSLIQLSKSPEIVSIKGTVVTLEDGSTISAEEYENRVARRIIEKADKGIKESKKALQEKLEETEKYSKTLQEDLEKTQAKISKLEDEKLQTAKLIGIHGDKLSQIVTLTNVKTYLNMECPQITGEVLSMVDMLNAVSDDLRRNPDVLEGVSIVFSALRGACRRIINSWAPYNPDGFNFGVAYTEKSESEEPFISKIPVISEPEPAVIEKPSNTEVSIAIRNIAEMYRSGASVEDRVSAIESLSAKLNQAQRSHIMDIVSLDKDSDAIEMLNDFASELEAIV